MIARWWQNDLIPLVLQHVDFHDLLALELTAAFQEDQLYLLRRCYEHLGRSTGAVCFKTREVVGESDDPKRMLLHWHRKRSAFLDRVGALQQGLCSREINLRSATSSSAPTELEVLPCQVPHVDVNRLLPLDERPVFPLAFGVREGFASYFGFRFSWEEHGNGEACQVGVNVKSPRELLCDSESVSQQLLFSPSAGAVFHKKNDSRWRAWPLDDLWVDALEHGTRLELEAGVYIDEGGNIFLYRRASIPKSHRDSQEALQWEVVGGLELDQSQSPSGTREFYIFLSLLDACTPLRATITHVRHSEPP